MLFQRATVVGALVACSRSGVTVIPRRHRMSKRDDQPADADQFCWPGVERESSLLTVLQCVAVSIASELAPELLPECRCRSRCSTNECQEAVSHMLTCLPERGPELMPSDLQMGSTGEVHHRGPGNMHDATWTVLRSKAHGRSSCSGSHHTLGLDGSRMTGDRNACIGRTAGGRKPNHLRNLLAGMEHSSRAIVAVAGWVALSESLRMAETQVYPIQATLCDTPCLSHARGLSMWVEQRVSQNPISIWLGPRAGLCASSDFTLGLSSSRQPLQPVIVSPGE